MKTVVNESVKPNAPSFRFHEKKQEEAKGRWGAANAKSRKPSASNEIPNFVSPTESAESKSTANSVKSSFKWWSLLSVVIAILGILVFRKSVIASLIWAGGAVFLGVLVTFCIIGLLLSVMWAMHFRRNKKKREVGFSVMFFLISCALSGIGAKYVFNMESGKPEYKQVIVGGIERNLTPHIEHLVVKFRDGSDWYFEPKRLVGEEETNVSEPAFFVMAIIAIEDERFLERLEGAVDFRSIGRILYRRIRGKIWGETNNEGGSTLAMQIAKNLKNDPNDPEKKQLVERTVSAKFDEAIVAQRIDNEFTPEQQLALYANLCDGSYRGMADVANDLFNVNDLRQLELHQAALLIAIPKSPATFNPRTNASKAKERRDLILVKMKELKFISDEQFEKAVNAKIEVLKKRQNTMPSFLYALNYGDFK